MGDEERTGADPAGEERTGADPAGEPEGGTGGEPAGTGGCAVSGDPLSDETEPHCAPTHETTTVTVAADPAEAIRGWPRRVIARRNGDALDAIPRAERGRARRGLPLFLYFPESTTRWIHFTADTFREYLTATGQPERDSRSVAGWGVKTTLELPVSKIVEERTEVRGAVRTEHRLVFDPSDAETRYSFDVYNLSDSQPAWRRILERTLMILPLAHLQSVRLKSVFFDFRAGTSRIGPDAGISTGGTNWWYSTRERGPHAPEGIDEAGCATICATYAALNRPWGHHRFRDGRLPTTESGIDDAYASPTLLFDTLYHELGHLVCNRIGSGRMPLWNRYRIATAYDGESDGADEGFAEAYRQRLKGDRFDGNPELDPSHAEDAAADINADMEEAFAAIGLPTLRSVNDARAAIRAQAATPPAT